MNIHNILPTCGRFVGVGESGAQLNEIENLVNFLSEI